jgi:flagellar biosynthesis protein FliP
MRVLILTTLSYRELLLMFVRRPSVHYSGNYPKKSVVTLNLLSLDFIHFLIFNEVLRFGSRPCFRRRGKTDAESAFEKHSNSVKSWMVEN